MRSIRSFALVLATATLSAGLATPALAQLRQRVQRPPVRIPSTLTTTDSTTLVEATAARVAAGAPNACVVAVASDISGPAGQAFVRAVRMSLPAAPVQTDDGSSSGLTLTSLSDGDTATAIVRHVSGDTSRLSETWVEYYFVRGAEPTTWRHVGNMNTGFGDYVVVPGQQKRRRKPCLKGRTR